MQRRVPITSQGKQITIFRMRSMVDIQMTVIAEITMRTEDRTKEFVEIREEKMKEIEAVTEGNTLIKRDIPMKRNITMQVEVILETRIFLT